jgi:hypothetical protein
MKDEKAATAGSADVSSAQRTQHAPPGSFSYHGFSRFALSAHGTSDALPAVHIRFEKLLRSARLL